MKKIKFIAMAFAGLLLASCMGDGYADPNDLGSTIGNNEIKESNVITIAQLKDDYYDLISNKKYTCIDKDIQIKGIVTGNDIGGNIYQEVCLQDETGGILVCINKSGIYGELPVGQKILVDLKGLYVGGYGSQAEVGGIYTNSNTGAQSIGKADRYVWNQHFKLIGKADPAKAESMIEVFDKSRIKDAEYLKACSGKLMKIEKVQFTQADGTAVYAPESEKDNANCVNRSLTDAESGSPISTSNMVVRTSSYAKFANAALPTKPVDITGVFTRFNNIWQILVRTTDDVKEAVIDKSGTAEQPYTFEQALAIINAGTYKDQNVYTTGVICGTDDISTSYGNATYYISADGQKEEGKYITVFRGKYLDGASISDENKDMFQVGKKVTICGKLTMYTKADGTNTPEINSGNYLVSIQ